LLESSKPGGSKQVETKHSKERLQAHPTERKRDKNLHKTHASITKVELKTNSKTKGAECDRKPTSVTKKIVEVTNSEEKANSENLQKIKDNKSDSKLCSSEHQHDEEFGTPV